MADKLKERLRHMLLAILLSVGLVMPLCGALDKSLLSTQLLYLIGSMTLLFELASLHRIAAWVSAAAAAAAVVIWVFTGNGARMLSDAGFAVSLRMQGVMTAVPLAAQEVSFLITVGMTLLCCFAVLRSATCIPALMLSAVVIMIVWATDSMEMLPWLLPALAAVLTLVLTYRFEDTPALRVLPWAAGLTALAFLLTGSGPADNPLKDKADEIRQSILDRLFFTEARDVYSLYSVGLSPQGAEQLGGPPNPSENAVMQVSTPKTVYLRGTVYNRYTGHGWQNTNGGRRYLWQSGKMAETRAVLFDEKLPPVSVQNSLSEPQNVSIRMLSGSASTLFVPQRVRKLNPGGETVPYFSNSSEIFITRNLQAGDTWDVYAILYSCMDPGIGNLTELCAALDDPRWENVREMYTELPGHLEKPVQDLAYEITSAASTPYEKAMAIQNYLKRNYKYSLEVGEHPENIDFVTSFLLDTKKGYCTYFASAMTVLCRMAGLPARYVEGYLAEPNENGEAIVTGLNAHAWTEVYFSGFGWLTFDATPGQQNNGQQNGVSASTPAPTPTPTPEPPAATPTPEPEGEEGVETPEPTDAPENTPEEGADENPSAVPSGAPSETPFEAPEDQPEKRPEDEPEIPEEPANPPKGPKNSFPWWVLILAGLAAAVGIRGWTTSPVFREKHADTEEKRFDIWAGEIAELMRAEHIERRNGETPIAFTKRVDGTGRFSESVTPAGECLALIRYSRKKPDEQDTGLMRDTAMLVWSEISEGAKMRYLIRRLLSNKGIKRIIKGWRSKIK